MSIRSLMLGLTVSLISVTAASAGPTATTQGGGGGGPTGPGGFQCTNGVGVGCIGSIATFPITVNIQNVQALDCNQLTVLSDDLNSLSLLDGSILDGNKILDDVKLDVLTDFLDKFGINVSKNDINVCTVVLGIQLCK